MSFAGLVAGRPRRKSGFFAELLDGLMAKPGPEVLPHRVVHRIAPPRGMFQPREAAPEFTAPPVVQMQAPAAAKPTRPVFQPRVAALPLASAAQAAPTAMPTAMRLLAMQWQQRQQKLVAGINATLSPTSNVMAWCVLPTQLFEGDAGRFLMLACDMFACSPANTMLLPIMPSGCEALDLPRHPMAGAASAQVQAQHKITSLYRQAQDDHKRAALALKSGDTSAVFSSGARHSDYQRQIAQIIRDTAEQVLGRDAVDRHDTRFRSHISKM